MYTKMSLISFIIHFSTSRIL